MLLKKYAKKGFTLYQIGELIYREDEEEPSQMERVIEWAETMFNMKQ